MKLYYKTSNNKQLLGEYDFALTCCDAIHSYLVEHNYRSYYWRILDGEELTIDFGSYTDFFKVEGCTFNDLCVASSRHYEEEHLRQITIDSWNLPAVCSGDDIYFAFPNSFTKQQAERIRQHDIKISEETVELIGVKRGKIPSLQRSACNGFHCETQFCLQNISVDFLWVKIEGKELYYRLYKISAEAKYLDYTNNWAYYKENYGNQVLEWEDNRFSSFVYHLCRESTEDFPRCGSPVMFTSKEECMADLKVFQLEDWHYRECLEDLLGDVG